MLCPKCGTSVGDRSALCPRCSTTVQWSMQGQAGASGAGVHRFGDTGRTVEVQRPYAGFWLRVFAGCIDASVVFVVYSALNFFWLQFFRVSLVEKLMIFPPPAQPQELGFFRFKFDLLQLSYLSSVIFGNIVVAWWYVAFFESSGSRATPGKMCFSIYVSDSHGEQITFARASFRHFFKCISWLTLLVGFLMSAFTPQKQSLHDMLAGCLVEREQNLSRLRNAVMAVISCMFLALVLLFFGSPVMSFEEKAPGIPQRGSIDIGAAGAVADSVAGTGAHEKPVASVKDKLMVRNEPVYGRIGPNEFRVTSGEFLAQRTLVLRSSSSGQDTVIVKIHLPEKYLVLDGVSFDVNERTSAGSQVPRVQVTVKSKERKTSTTRQYSSPDRYSLYLEFDNVREHNLLGRMRLQLWDQEKSHIEGSFQAVVH